MTDSFPRFLRHIAVSRRGDPRSDAELLAEFSRWHDGDAFAALVTRHGPLVWGVCYRLLPDPHDAEDAFQATFLVLARKAAALAGHQAIPGWLYVVARRTVQDMRKAGRRRQHRERQAFTMRSISDTAAPNPDLTGAVDEALAELPEKYRTPLVLCYLQGRTHAEAARELGCAVGSVSWKLSRGCEMLRRRLATRGVALATGAAVAILTRSQATAAMPLHLVRATTAAALEFTAGTAAASTAARVAENVVQTMSGTKVKVCGLLLVLLTGAGLGVGFGQPAPASVSVGDATPAPVAAAPEEKVLTDRVGDPLPEGALARIGSSRLRQVADHIAFLADGRSFVAGGGSDRLPIVRGQSIRVWDRATGKELRHLDGYPDGVHFLAFSPKTRLVAFRGGEPSDVIRLWDAETGKEQPLPAPVRWTGAVACCPDGKLVVLAAKPGTFKLVDVDSGATRVEANFDNQTCVVHAFTWSPDGKLLALSCSQSNSRPAGRDHSVRIWDPIAAAATRTLETPQIVRTLAWSPDGATLAGAADMSKGFLWDPAAGTTRDTFLTDNYGILAFSPDGKRLAYSTDYCGSLAIRDVASGKVTKPAIGPGWAVARAGAAFTPDGKSLFVGMGSAIRCWNAATGEEDFSAADTREMIFHSAYSHDGRYLATADMGGGVRLWDTATGRPLRTVVETTKAATLAQSQTMLAFAPDDRRLYAVVCTVKGWTRKVRVWDVAGTEPAREFAVDRGMEWTPVLSPDGKYLAVGATGGGKGGGMCQILDTATGKEVARLDTAYITVRATFTPDGQGLATAGLALELWDKVTSKPTRVRSDPLKRGQYFAAMAYSPDGKVLATADGSEGVWLWEAATGALLYQGVRMEKPHKSHIGYDLAFSPDSRTLATAESDGRIHLWERASGQEVCQLTGHHDGAVREVAFAGDGRRLVSRGDDGTALVWDVGGHVPGRPQRAEPLAANEVEGLGDELASPDAPRAYRAIRELTAVPDQAVRLLADRLHPAPQPDAGRVKKLLHDLDADAFAERQRAAHDLGELGDAAAGDLRDALKGSPSAEVRRQVEELLRQCQADDGAVLARVRGVAVLEYVGTPAARKLLESLAAGAPGARMTVEAKAALGRLAPGRR